MSIIDTRKNATRALTSRFFLELDLLVEILNEDVARRRDDRVVAEELHQLGGRLEDERLFLLLRRLQLRQTTDDDPATLRRTLGRFHSSVRLGVALGGVLSNDVERHQTMMLYVAATRLGDSINEHVRLNVRTRIRWQYHGTWGGTKAGEC